MEQIIVAAAIAAGFVLLTGPFFIPELHKLKFGQSIRAEGPKSHQAKSGTPTMGGIMIILGITIATVIAAPLTPEVLLALFIMLGHFVLGFLDDYIKVVKKRNLGLRAKQKFLGQLFIAVVTMFIGTQVLGIDTTIWLPVVNEDMDIGVVYYFLVAFVLVGTSNAVNLTDGLDGLASGLMAIAAAHHAGVSIENACAALGTFINAKRRLEVKGNVQGVTVYDDFAHHPTEIQATLTALRDKVGQNERILAVLEPRSNTMKMGIHKEEIAPALEKADAVFLFQPDTIPWKVAEIAAHLTQPAYDSDNLDDFVHLIAAEAKPTDHILVMSNGSFGGIHQKLLDALEKKTA